MSSMEPELSSIISRFELTPKERKGGCPSPLLQTSLAQAEPENPARRRPMTKQLNPMLIACRFIPLTCIVGFMVRREKFPQRI